MTAYAPSANLYMIEDKPAQLKAKIEEKAKPASDVSHITPKASPKEIRFLSENSKLIFDKKIISKYIIFEIFSYSSGYSYKKIFSFISQISLKYKLFLLVNRELGQSMLTYIQLNSKIKIFLLLDETRESIQHFLYSLIDRIYLCSFQILNVQGKDKACFIIDQKVSVRLLKQVSLEFDLNIKEYSIQIFIKNICMLAIKISIENSNPQQQLKELAKINNLSLKKLALKNIVYDERFTEGLSIIHGGFPFLETLELELDY